ncbi:MAG: hypothetical protein P8Z79_14045 [Sedimentisphaerales bacterium]
MNKKYIVRLTNQDRENLETLTQKGRTQAYRIKQAHILLAVDADGPNWDEQPTQLIKETRRKITVASGPTERVDYEYERNGTAANFMVTKPWGRWRKVDVRERKTSVDWQFKTEDAALS